MNRDTGPLATYFFAAAALLALADAGGTPDPIALGAALGLVAWAFIERMVSARVPRPLAVAVDFALLSTFGILVVFRPGGPSAALRLAAHVLALAQFSRALRRKHRGDVMAMHGIAAATLAVGAFLTRDGYYLLALLAAAMVGTIASVGLVTRSTGAAGETRVLLSPVRVRPCAISRSLQFGAMFTVLLLAAAVVFVVLPRGTTFRDAEVAASRPEEPDPTDYSRDVEEGAFRIAGFSDRVRLGDVGRIKLAPWPAFVVQTTKGRAPVRLPPEALYFRGRALDAFDGRQWSAARGPGRGPPVTAAFLPAIVPVPGAPRESGAEVLEQEYVLRPAKTATLFLLDAPAWIRFDSSLPRAFALGAACLEAASPHREGLTYRAASRPPAAGAGVVYAADLPGPANFALPPLARRVADLAVEGAGSGPALARARNLEAFLRDRCEYTLSFSAEPGPRPIEDFLFATRAGHCEYFASALAVLLRAQGIGTRLIVGYRGGLWLSDEAAFLVRQSDAHAWVEAHVPGTGWIRLDATPGDQSAVAVPPARLPGAAVEEALGLPDVIRLVGNFGPDQRERLFRGARAAVSFLVREGVGIGRPSRAFPPPALVLALAFALLLGGRAALRRRQRKTAAFSMMRVSRSGEANFYVEALRALRARGIAPQPASTPREFASEARQRLGEDHTVFLELTRVFEDVRYGGRALPPGDAAALRVKARSLRPERSARAVHRPSGVQSA